MFRISEKEGDSLLLKDAIDHSNLEDCEICQNHAVNNTMLDYCQNCNAYAKLNYCPNCHKEPTINSKDILLQIKITSSSSAQNEAPKFLEIDVSGKILQEMPEIQGVYARQYHLINRFPCWKHVDNNYVIWFDKNEYWSVSRSQDIGTSCWIFASSVQSNKWPDDIPLPWRHNAKEMDVDVADEKVLFSVVSKLLF